MSEDDGPIVEPGHDAQGHERRFAHGCCCATCRVESVDPDLDLLITIRDWYYACAREGTHPESTVWGGRP